MTATDVYWTTQQGIFQLPLGGATPATLWSGFPSVLSYGSAIDSTNLCFSASTYVAKVPLAGGALTPSVDAPGALVVGSSNVYFVDGSGGTRALSTATWPEAAVANKPFEVIVCLRGLALVAYLDGPRGSLVWFACGMQADRAWDGSSLVVDLLRIQHALVLRLV